MNYAIFQEWLMKIGFVGAAAFTAALFLYFLREPLYAALERFHRARRLTRLVVLLAFAGATLFGGAKYGSNTNDPSGGVSGDSSPTNDPPMVGGVLWTPRNLTANEISFCGDCGGPGVSALPSTCASITNWTARGAYCDWHRIDFPETFAFPSGTNLLTGLTLMSYGELRQTLQGPSLATFNQPTNEPTNLSFGDSPLKFSRSECRKCAKRHHHNIICIFGIDDDAYI